MGRKKVLSEEEIKDMVLPVANDVLGIAVKLLGLTEFWLNVKTTTKDFAESGAK